MNEKIKEAFRWCVRRDFDAGNTMLGGFVEKISVAFTSVVGVGTTVSNGSVVIGLVYAAGTFASLFVAKCILGYIDMRYVGATKYRNYYGSHITPMYVKLIDDDKNDLQNLRDKQRQGP